MAQLDFLHQLNQDQLDWTAVTPAELQKQAEAVFQRYTDKLLALSESEPDALSFLHEITCEPPKMVTIASTMNSLRGDLGFSDIEVAVETMWTKLKSAVFQNKLLEKLVKAQYPSNSLWRRYKELVLKHFRPQPEELLNEYTKLSVQFTDCIKKDQKENKLILDRKPEYLEGLEPAVVEHITKTPDKIELDSTAFVNSAIMRKAKSAELREKYWRFQQERCPENAANIEKQLPLKQKIGEFYNHPSVCELNLEERMARTVDEIREFQKQLKDTAFGRYLRDIEELKKKYNLEKMHPWDLSYYAEQDKMEACSFDLSAMDKYFEFGGFLERFLAFLEELYGVKITHLPERAAWHPAVTSYKITRGSESLGTLHLDLIQRPDKVPGAYFNKLGPKTFVVMCNYPPKPEDPQKRHEIPFDDVETTFHEFGHCFHAVMSRVGLEALEATDVFWDFVEVPSQFFENFSYQAEVLQKIGKDKDGNPVPLDYVEKLNKRKKYLQSLFVIGQLNYGVIDLALHSSQEWAKEEPKGDFSRLDVYLNKILKDYRYDFGFEYKTIIRHFSHIFSSVHGYTCGYYCYLWADVIQYHLFEHFEKHHDFQKYVDCILAQGNLKNPGQLVQDFCGGYGFDAFKRALGLE